MNYTLWIEKESDLYYGNSKCLLCSYKHNSNHGYGTEYQAKKSEKMIIEAHVESHKDEQNDEPNEN
jgi:hypothetical protein